MNKVPGQEQKQEVKTPNTLSQINLTWNSNLNNTKSLQGQQWATLYI
jgi:hypothetical protein